MSLELIKEITLDLQEIGKSQQIIIKSGNNLSNVILVTLINNGQIVDLNQLNARYCILRADGTNNLSDAEIENNKAKIVLTKSDLSTLGVVSCEIILSENEKVVFSSTFYIKVLPNSLAEQRVKLSDEYSSIINVLDKADKMVTDVSTLEQQVSDNESLRITRENLRIENENVRQENELNRQNLFTQIETKSKQIVSENIIQVENAKTQGEYAKTQGDYAKEQADRIAQSDISNLQNQVDELLLVVDQIQTQVDSLQIEVDDLKGYIGYTDTDIYGVEIDFKNSKFTRLAGATNLTEGANFDNINAYNRRRCILNDNGEVVAYYGDDGYIEDGTVGQAMVEQPKFYYKVVPLELDPIEDGKGCHLRKARYYISDTQKCSFKLHPAFIQNGVEKDKIYLSAYEGCIYDTSASTYLLNDEQVADFNNDKLSSIANAKPCSGTTQKLTRPNSRKLANNRGSGWNLSTINTVSATQLLFLIEYASFNMQEKIGRGVVDKSNATSTNFSEKTGLTTSLGNKTGIGINNAITYRGEENFYGNIWKCIDGINAHELNSQIYIYISDNNFRDDTSELPYKDIGINMPHTEGYISAFGYNSEYDWLFIASETNGNSAVPVGDYSYPNDKKLWTTMVLGGLWNVNDKGGGFCQVYNNDATYNKPYINYRLSYI